MQPSGRSARGAVSLSLLLWVAAGRPATPASLSAPSSLDNEPAQAFTLRDERKALPQKPPRPLPSERAGLDLALLPEVRLPGIDAAQLLREDEAMTTGTAGISGTKVLRFGVGRDVAVAARDGNWYDLEGGARLWAVEVAATGALAVKLHFRGVHLPPGAVLAVYDPAAKLAGDRRQAVRQPWDAEFHDSQAPAGEFWTWTIGGERARIEYYVPAAAANSREIPFTVDRLQHVYRDPVAALYGESKSKAAGPCHNDVSCYPEWAALARAVAGIAVVDTDFLFCSGQLLNSQKPDFTPYWLTANHCLSTAESAQLAEIFWLYQTATCGGAPPALASVPRSAGATLLSTSGVSDYTLLLIEGALPPDLTWAGWTSAKVKDGTPSLVIHHPEGDFKRISFGNKGSSDACASKNLVRVNWTDGPTEPGSSGSGVFRSDTQQLYGQLFFGPSSCDDESFDCFGAFATTYPRIKSFLRNGGSDDRSEQNDTCQKARGVKAGTLGARIVKSVDPDWYKMPVPAHKTLTVTVTFNHPWGDIDLRFFPSCGGDPFVVSEGDTNVETFSVTNVGTRPANAMWEVYLFSDVRNAYDMTVAIH